MCDNHSTRTFWKCDDCLSVIATEGAQQFGRFATMKCGLCSASMWNMGRVQRDRLVHDETRCACDERCTAALGPDCDCRCGGANHGTGRVVHVTIDAGGIPVAQVQADVKILKQLVEFRAARDAVRAELTALNEMARKAFIARPLFMRKLALQKALTKAQKMSSHHGRMKTLRAVLEIPVTA